MTTGKTIETLTAPIETTCRGIDHEGNPVLEDPIVVQIEVVRENLPKHNIIGSRINCPYIAGGHQNKCRAFDQQETGRYDIYCKYAFSFLEKKDIKRREDE